MLAAQSVAFRLALAGGPVGALLLRLLSELRGLRINVDPSWTTLAMMLLLAPIVEEFAFREFVQRYLKAFFAKTDGYARLLITPQNMGTSVLFAACHLVSQSAPAAVLTIVPSLYLG